jgi:acyl-CoA thioesterase FadM
MVLLLRLLLHIALSRFRRKVGPLEEAVLTMRAWPNDLDLNMHVNSGRYVTFMDVGRMELVARMRVMREALKRKWRPLVGGSTILYRKSVLPFEKFRVRSRVVCWDEKWFYFEHTVENSRGEMAATAHVRALIRGPEGNVTPREFVALTGQTIDSPPMPEALARWNATQVRA